MRRIDTEILVVGGGATGAGVLRDLAMRGFKAVLVEKGDLAHGTTGRYHGLLHSGGRYVVKDPQAARECIEENRILRRILPFCIEDTGGFFVVTPWDDPDYAPRFMEGCRNAGIPVEEVPITEMLRQEPLLNPRISHCFRVPDGSADSFLATEANIASAREHGAEALTYHPLVRLLTEGEAPGAARVTGAICHDRVRDEEVHIHADLVVNAAGAWAGLVASTVGVRIHIVPGKGVMLAANRRIINTVVNRCKMPSDGDILVPIHTVTVIGTTDVRVDDPDRFAIEPWEVRLCLEEGDKLVPGFKDMRMLRAWAGVRPLYQESQVSDTRDVTRAFVLLDHEVRDGVAGLITITSGKWTTYRKMAEVTVNMACRKVGVERPCRTAQEPLPDLASHNGQAKTHRGAGYYYMGGRLANIEAEKTYGELVCECELATRKDVESALLSGQAWTLDDIRRDVRLGMGPCQGGFCTYRAAGLAHRLAAEGKLTLARPLGQLEDRSEPFSLATQTNLALRDFLQERWKGLLPILWGQQLRQERLDELVYLSVLNADHLPGSATGRLSPENYAQPEGNDRPVGIPAPVLLTGKVGIQKQMDSRLRGNDSDLLVVGGGLAGLFTAWLASAAGLRTRLVTKGWGALYWNAGTIDVLGYYPLERSEPVNSPAAALRQLIREYPEHPYALFGVDGLRSALEAFQELCQRRGYPLYGSLERNWLLPTALGTLRPTCLAPETMIAGDLRQPGGMLLVGLERYLDFYPHLAADNLSMQGIPARAAIINLPALSNRRIVSARLIADLCASPEFLAEMAGQIRPHLEGVSRVGMPAFLGFGNSDAHSRLQDALGVPVFEIPTLPPSIPGMRLHRLLVDAIEEAGGTVYDGMQATGFQVEGDQITQANTEAAARHKQHRAWQFVLASGGILGGGLRSDHRGHAWEALFDLPLLAPPPDRWLREEFLDPQGHPIFRLGLQTDRSLRPVNDQRHPVYGNLQAVGAALGGGELVRERSLEGVALSTAFYAVETILSEAAPK